MKTEELKEMLYIIDELKELILTSENDVKNVQKELNIILEENGSLSKDLVAMLNGEENYLSPMKNTILQTGKEFKNSFNKKEFTKLVDILISEATKADEEIKKITRFKIFATFITKILRISQETNQLLCPMAADIINKKFIKINDELNSIELK